MLLIVSGPPVFRTESRSALDTLQTNVDFWVFYQLVVYLLAFAIASPLLLKIAHHPMPRDVWRRAMISIAFCFLLMVSAFWAPSFASTFVLAAMFMVGVLVAFQFSFVCARCNVPILPMLCSVRWLIFLLFVVAIVMHHQGLIGFAKWGSTGLRYRGNTIVNALLLAPITTIISLYCLVNFRSFRWQNFTWLLLGLIATYLTRTRASYAITGIGILMVAWLWLKDSRYMTVKAIGLRMVFAALVLVILLFTGLIGGGFLDEQWTRGEGADIATFSKRTLIWEWIIDRVIEQPYGYGFTTGFRSEFLGMNPIDAYEFRTQGLAIQRIGEAHSSYFEVLMATGWLGLALALAILLPMLYQFLSHFRHEDGASADTFHAMRLGAILVIMMAVDATNTSAYANAFRQPFGFFLLVVALTSASIVRNSGLVAHRRH